MPHIEEAALHAYLDGAAPPADAARLEAHLEDCERCRTRIEDVREVRERASGLLASLEPGPIHAPAFAELEARASRRSAGAVDGSAAVVGSPWWRRPSLAWAATLALAFGLGWLLRAELGAPSGLFSGPAASFDRRAATAPGAHEQDRDELPGADEKALPGAPGEAGAASQQAPPDALSADTGAASNAAEEAAAPESSVTVTAQSPVVDVVQPPGAPPAGGVAGEPVADPPVVANAAPPDAIVAGPPATAPPQSLVPGALAEEVRAERLDELEAAVGAMSLAAAEGSGRYLLVSGGDIESWLGAPPRRLPELTLLRAEVGPPSASPDGSGGSPVVRLVYRSENGPEITLTQQLAAAGETGGGRAPVDADARLRTEAARRQASAGRELFLRADLAADDLPATVVEPDGMVTYRWRDADGYLLALSGSVDADVLRALADRVR